MLIGFEVGQQVELRRVGSGRKSQPVEQAQESHDDPPDRLQAYNCFTR